MAAHTNFSLPPFSHYFVQHKFRLLSFFNIEVDADRGTITIKTEERATFYYEADQGAALLGVSAQAEEESDKCNQS